MDTFDAIYQRRSVKAYDPQHEMSEAEVTKLMEAAVQSPTSFNMQNWRFVLIKENKELRTKLREAAYNQAQVEEASLVIILAADLNAHSNDPARYWKDAPEETGKMMSGMLAGFYADKEQLQRDEAQRSCAIAGQTIMLAAKAMGYDTRPMIGFDIEKVGQIINLPEDHLISFMITVGKQVKPAWPKPGQLELSEVVIWDGF